MSHRTGNYGNGVVEDVNKVECDTTTTVESPFYGFSPSGSRFCVYKFMEMQHSLHK